MGSVFISWFVAALHVAGWGLVLWAFLHASRKLSPSDRVIRALGAMLIFAVVVWGDVLHAHRHSWRPTSWYGWASLLFRAAALVFLGCLLFRRLSASKRRTEGKDIGGSPGL